jgi:hypothetical protein
MISLIIFGAGDEGEREKGAESREQRAQRRRAMTEERFTGLGQIWKQPFKQGMAVV